MTNDRASVGKRVSILAICMNLSLVILKGIVGYLSGSVSIIGDAVNNLSDSCSAIITLVGFEIAARPADAEHPYGHGRIEYLSGLAVAVMVMAIGINLFISSIERCLHPEWVQMTQIMFFLMILSIAVKFVMFIMYQCIGKRLSSGAMHAAAADSRNDMLMTTAILAAAWIEKKGHFHADGWMGLVIAMIIMVGSIRLISEQISPLLGRVPDKDEVARIRAHILSAPEILGCHDLMIHDYGPGRQFASVHVEMPANMQPIQMHEIIDGIENDLLQEDGLHMVIHCDPVVTDDPRLTEMKTEILRIGNELCPGMSIHDLRIVPTAVRSKVIFDCVLPYDVPNREKTDMEQIRRKICERFARTYPDYICIPTMEHSFTDGEN